MHFQIACMQFGSVLYSLAQVANKVELLIAGRVLVGFGGSYYPVYQFIAEMVGKKHRSHVMGVCGVGRALGFCLGPVVAAILVYVDFHIGDLTINKETNAGWTVAIYCAFQTAMVVWYFPREGSKLVGRKRRQDLGGGEEADQSNGKPLKEKVLHNLMLGFVIMNGALPSKCHLSRTRAIQQSNHPLFFLSFRFLHHELGDKRNEHHTDAFQLVHSVLGAACRWNCTNPSDLCPADRKAVLQNSRQAYIIGLCIDSACFRGHALRLWIPCSFSNWERVLLPSCDATADLLVCDVEQGVLPA